MSEILRGVWQVIVQIFSNSGYAYFFTADGGWKNAVMLVVAFVFLYLGIKKGFEPLLMIPIAFGMLLANIPSANLAVHYSSIHEFIDLMAGRLTDASGAVLSPGLIDFLYFGVKAGVYPPLIFMGIGAMTDFAPLIANPSSFILGAAAQLGIFFTYVGAILLGFTPTGRFYRYYRWCGRSYSHFRYLPVGTGIVGYDCCGGVLLYGLGAHYSAPHYARADDQERAQRGDGQPAPCFQAGEDFVPHFGNGHCIFAAAGCSCTGGYAHVR